MNRNNIKIQDLEKRLSYLKKRYRELTEDLVRERNSMISDEQGNYDLLENDRVFVTKQIHMIRNRMKAKSRLKTNAKFDKAEVGTCVKLENHKKSMKIFLVSEDEANPTSGHATVNSPIGKAIIGKREGDEVKVDLPVGIIEYRIREIC